MCIEATMGQRIAHPEGAHLDTEGTCGIEVGLPIRPRDQGHLPVITARRIAADEANAAAYAVLERSHGVTAATCGQIIVELDRRLGSRVDQASAAPCGSTSVSHLVPVVRWPGPPPGPSSDSQGTCEAAMPDLDECWGLASGI